MLFLYNIIPYYVPSLQAYNNLASTFTTWAENILTPTFYKITRVCVFQRLTGVDLVTKALNYNNCCRSIAGLDFTTASLPFGIATAWVSMYVSMHVSKQASYETKKC